MGKTERFELRVTPEDRQMLAVLERRLGMSKGEVVRRLIHSVDVEQLQPFSNPLKNNRHGALALTGQSAVAVAA